MRFRCFVLVAAVGSLLGTPSSLAALYKWVDENGRTNYSDSLPPKHPSRAGERLNKSAVRLAKIEAPRVDRVNAQDTAQQAIEAKRQLERKRQDTALLATYASEREIELARERELQRHRDVLGASTAGLAGARSPEERRKLDALLERGRAATDAINAKFDAHKARFRELTGGGFAAGHSAAAGK